jgi:predicted hydrolase (HD superfamily)
VGHAAADGPVDGLAGEQAVDEAGGKAVAAADAVEDVDVALRDVDDLVLVKRNRAPGVAAGGVRGAQRAGDELQVGIKAATSRSISS